MTEEIKTELENEEKPQSEPVIEETEGVKVPSEEEQGSETAGSSDADEVKKEDENSSSEEMPSEEAKPRASEIDSFDGIAQVASEAAEKAADQVSQTAKSAYSYTTKAAKSAGEFAKKAAAQAAENAERNQALTDAVQAFQELDTEPVKNWKDVAGTAWSRYLSNHISTLLYGLVGLIAGFCILAFGFWKVALVLACTWIGIMYGRYREGDPKFVDFLRRHLEDDE